MLSEGYKSEILVENRLMHIKGLNLLPFGIVGPCIIDKTKIFIMYDVFLKRLAAIYASNISVSNKSSLLQYLLMTVAKVFTETL